MIFATIFMWFVTVVMGKTLLRLTGKVGEASSAWFFLLSLTGAGILTILTCIKYLP